MRQGRLARFLGSKAALVIAAAFVVSAVLGSFVGGAGARTSAPTTQVTPVVSAPADQSSDEGSAHSFDLGSFSDPGVSDGPWSVDVDWGDGHSSSFDTSSQGSLGSLAHTYADNGSYTVAVSVTDKDGGTGSASFTATVANVAPSVTAAANQSSNEGESHSFGLGSFSDPGANDAPWHVVVDWGDGHSSSFDTSSQGSLGSLAHTYQDNGLYSVSVNVTDKDGATGGASFTASVANVDPTADLANDGPVDEGSPATVSFSNASDPSSADTAAGFHYAFACDDGSLAGATYGGSGTSDSTQCTFADNGTYPVRARIIDKDGGFSEYTTNVIVTNVAPSVTAAANQSSDEGSSHSFDLGSFTDPGGDSPWSVDVDWGDGSPHTTFSAASPGALGSKSHTYDDNGSHTVTVKVTDKDGGSGQAQFTANVANVAPTATFSNDGPVSEGSDFHLFLSSPSDPSGVDTSAGLQYAFDCGSGYGAFSGTASATCSTTDNGVRSVKGKIRDKDGGVSEYTASVTVNNVNPAVAASADQSSNEGENHSFSLGSFGDPGADSPWSVDVDWGDGSPHTTFSKTTTGSLGSQSHTYADNGSYTVKVKVTDKDGGYGSATFKVTVLLQSIEMKFACALKSNGLMRYVSSLNQCKSTETQITIKPGPISVCVNPDGSVRKIPPYQCKKPGTRLTLPPASGAVYFCANNSSGVLRYPNDPSQCATTEFRVVVTANTP